jgi:M6 family metalloprotease-like protein
MKHILRTIRSGVFLAVLTLCAAETATVRAAEDVSLQGWLTVIWGDEASGASIGPFFKLTEENGMASALVITEAVRQRVGDVLSLNGRFVGITGTADRAQPLVQDRGEAAAVTVSSIAVLPAPDSSAMMMDTQEAPLVSGSRPWLSIMCKFSDFNVEPKSLGYFQNMYADTYPGLNHYWRELSYDTANISGSSAAGWFVLPHDEAYYNPSDTQGGTDRTLLANDCLAAADASVDFSRYSGINMMFNTDFDNGLAWGGTRYMTLDGVSKVWSITWEPPWGYADITVIGHEMGHGFGLPHSSGNYGQTYDNEWDVMSDSWSNCSRARDAVYGCLGQHTISYHKDKLGWIPAQQRYVVDDGTAVTLNLEQLAMPASEDPTMVKIPIADSPTNFYTVEVRRQTQTSYDYKLPGQGVIIHQVDTTRSIPAHVIDIDGDGDTGDDGAMWLAGEVFSDSANKISVEVLSATATGFAIRVRLGDLLGDLDLSGFVDLRDALLALQLTSGTIPSDVSISVAADVNNDQQLGLVEAIFVLQQLATQHEM